MSMKNLKENLEEIKARVMKEFMTSQAYNSVNSVDDMSLLCNMLALFDQAEEMYDDIQLLKQEIKDLKSKGKES